MASLAEIREKLKQQGDRKGGTYDNSIFPHWNLNENSTATVRYLPDADKENPFFWIEKLVIKMPFAGIKSEADSKPIIVPVPCMEMWNETCPVLAEVRGWFKDKQMEEMGRRYWKKRSYIFQGFVPDSGSIKEEKVPENPIRRLAISSQIFNIVKAALMDPEMEELPTDYNRGIDFRITKTTKGGYADYSTSSWARRERPLSEAENNAITEYGLHDLKSFLPKKPTAEDLVLIMEMFEASVSGELFDPARWGKFYRVNTKSDSESSDDTSTATQTKAEPKVEAKVEVKTEVEPKVEPVKTTVVQPKVEAKATGSKAEDILRMIRERKAASNQ